MTTDTQKTTLAKFQELRDADGARKHTHAPILVWRISACNPDPPHLPLHVVVVSPKVAARILLAEPGHLAAVRQITRDPLSVEEHHGVFLLQCRALRSEETPEFAAHWAAVLAALVDAVFTYDRTFDTDNYELYKQYPA